MPLNQEQIASFKNDGFLRINDFYDESTRDRWKSQIWDRAGTRLETLAEAPPIPNALNGFAFDAATEPAQYPPLLEIAAQLGGGQFGRGPDDHGGGGAPIVKWPRPEEPWQMPAAGHIDGYPPPDGWAPFMLGATTYLYDVESHGGSFVYWPGSHKSTHAYLLRNPSEVDGSFRQAGKGSIFTDQAEAAPEEFTAKAGDLLLWHSYTCHSGSPNSRPSPRFAVVVRFSHIRTPELEFRSEVPEDLWKYWAI